MKTRTLAAAMGTFAATAWAGCPDNQVENCLLDACICSPRTESLVPGVKVPPPAEVAKNVKRETEKLGQDTLTTIQKAGGDSIRTLQKAGGDTVATLQKAGGDTVNTFVKMGRDATANYVKAWKDGAEQTKRSFQDTVDAASAATNYAINQLKAHESALGSAEKRLREGKVVDSMWGLAIEPLQASEANFAKATQESTLIAAAASSAAAVYGGPGGAAAYAAWATYRATGDADQALRAGLLAAVTAQGGSAVSSMPSGTMGEVLKKSAMAGAAGGIAVAAAGGDEQAMQEGFLKSAGAVLVQAGSDKAKAYSPRAKDAWDTVQCVSARDLDCVSKTTWVRDAKGRIMTDANGKPRLDTKKLDPQQYLGKWSAIDPNSVEGKRNALVARISKLPKVEAIPLMKNKWVLSWTTGQAPAIGYGQPTVVLTYVGPNPPFTSQVSYSRGEAAPPWIDGTALPNLYACTLAEIDRTVRVTRQGQGCEAMYSREDGNHEIVWHSDHFPDICASKAAAFVTRLRTMGIQCNAQ